jgi:hypothetical protein
MKKTLALILSIGAVAFVPTLSFADGKANALDAMKTAREKLVALIDTKDKGPQDTLIKEIHESSDKADKELEALGDDAKAMEAKSVWEEFKNTRETEIIPAVQQGDAAKAKELAGSIQKERFKKIIELLQ